MGIGFDSTSMSWFLPKEKADRVIKRCLDVVNAAHVDLKTMEKVMGSVNDMSQLALMAKFYKATGNTMIRSFQGHYDILIPVNAQLRQDMLVLSKIADAARTGLPVPSRPCGPPLSALIFHTDAAGASYSWRNGNRVYHNNSGKGVSCIGGEEVSNIWAWTRLEWPEGFITSSKDQQGKLFGSKSTTLECVGLILPFISFPQALMGRHVIYKVDNMAVVHGWRNGHVKFDTSATELLKAVNVLASYLGVKVFVEHVPRMSTDLAVLADLLSRRDSHEWAAEALFKKPGLAMRDWLKDPVLNGSLINSLLAEIKLVVPI